uniref:Uncharacterized protein n=1 Tax=Cacopsylla melanoneura TaxID=428564 RepID=A0A8D8TAD9_9HEMI
MMCGTFHPPFFFVQRFVLHYLPNYLCSKGTFLTPHYFYLILFPSFLPLDHPLSISTLHSIHHFLSPQYSLLRQSFLFSYCEQLFFLLRKLNFVVSVFPSYF